LQYKKECVLEIISLRDNNEINSVRKLLNIDGAIHKVIIISAYTDPLTIKDLINYIRKNHDRRRPPSIRIFIDSSSSGFYTNKEMHEDYIKLSSRIKKFCKKDSGIYLVKWGSLFHSKFFLVQSTNYGKIIIGSLNFTNKGLTKNEELVLIEKYNVDGRAKANNIEKYIEKYYIEELKSKADKIDKNLNHSLRPSNLRHLLLNGNIYYTIKEQDPFRFKLDLPEDLIKQGSELNPLLEASTTNSISIVTLIGANKNSGGMGISFPEIKEAKKSWKRYCVETCYGFWNPLVFRQEIEDIIEKRIEKREPFFESIRDTINDKRIEISDCFYSFINVIRKQINDEYEWKFNDLNKVVESWGNWYDLLLEKIVDNDKYYTKLMSGITSVSTPDVWNDPLSSIEFEESFLESIIYYWSKEYSKETRNIIAKSISKNLDLSRNNREKLSTSELRGKIEKWFHNNSSLNILDLNEQKK
jgi:hypothetical protein